jgi:putative SOS response-associated peptidase YedK
MGPNGEEMETAAIVTTVANRELAALHERMPVILPPEAFDLWLDCRRVDAPTATALLLPARAGLLEAYEISPAVNRVANDGPELIAPVASQPAPPPVGPQARGARRARKDDDRQSSLF